MSKRQVKLKTRKIWSPCEGCGHTREEHVGKVCGWADYDLQLKLDCVESFYCDCNTGYSGECYEQEESEEQENY